MQKFLIPQRWLGRFRRARRADSRDDPSTVVLCSYTPVLNAPPILNMAKCLLALKYRVRGMGLADNRFDSSVRAAIGFPLMMIKRFKWPFHSPPFLFARYCYTLVTTSLSERPAMLIAYNRMAFFAAWLACTLSGNRLIYCQLEFEDPRTERSPRRRLALLVEGMLIRTGIPLFSVEPHRSRLMKRRYRLTYTPPAIYNAPLDSTSSGSPKGTYSGSLRLVYAGSVSAASGVGVFLRAVLQTDVPCSVDVIGNLDATFAGEFRDLLDRLCVRGVNATHRSHIAYSELQPMLHNYEVGIALYQRIDVNTTYCSPCKVFEYMAAGLAILASNFPGVRSVVEDRGCGRCVAPSDLVAIERAVRMFALHRLATQTMGQRARQAFVDHYNFETQVAPLIRAITATTRKVS